MKNTIKRVIATALTVCMCMVWLPTFASAANTVPETGSIAVTATANEQSSGAYNVKYEASLTIPESFATKAALGVGTQLIDKLVFTCVLEDAVVAQVAAPSLNDLTITGAGKDNFVFVSASKGQGNELLIVYKLNPTVTAAWVTAGAANVKSALMQPITISSSKNVDAQVINGVGGTITTTARVDISVEGDLNVPAYGQPIVTAAQGTTTMTVAPYSYGGGGAAGGSGTPSKPQDPKPEEPKPGEDEEDHPFEDVYDHDWYDEAVAYTYQTGVFKGVTTTKFEPKMSVTRGMIVTVFGRIDGGEDGDAVTEDMYHDVDNDKYYASHIEWAEGAGVAGGYGDGSFRPENTISREELAAIIYRYMSYKGLAEEVEGDVDYADADQISDWALKAVKFCQDKGIMLGKSGNNFDPKAGATRAEVATIIMRLFK